MRVAPAAKAFSIHFLCAIKWKNWLKQKWLLIGTFFLLFFILFCLTLFLLCWQEAYENVIFMCSENIKFSTNWSRKKRKNTKKLWEEKNGNWEKNEKLFLMHPFLKKISCTIISYFYRFCHSELCSCWNYCSWRKKVFFFLALIMHKSAEIKTSYEWKR